MRASLTTRALTVAAIAAVTVVTAGVTPGHAASYGTYTKITSPSGTVYRSFNANAGATNHFTVTGKTSSDVTEVDIDCIFDSTTGLVAATFASDVPVSGGAFSAIATVSNLTPQCLLKAVPSGDAVASTYLASFTGPVLYSEATGVVKSGAVVVGAIAAGEQGTGIAVAGEVGTSSSCDDVQLMATIRPPSMTVEGTGTPICLTSVGATNLADNGSATKVDGDNAYLPLDVASYLIADRSLAVTQSASTATFHLAANHDLTLTEAAPLMKCSHANTYPPTTASCPSLVKTGVSLTRVFTVTGGAHQVLTSYRFTSTDGHAHAISADLVNETAAAPSGAIGYAFPGHSSTPKPVTKAEKVTGLGKKAGTVVIRSDVDASASDPATQTYGITWSRAPSSLQFAAGSTSEFGLQYSLSVPAHGVADLEFADSEATTTSSVVSLARSAVAAVVAAPKVTKPGGTVHGTSTTVAGTVAAGANGLVRTVTVNGHKAKLTAVGTTSDKFTVTFKEAAGKHSLKVVATDVAGNTASTTVKVKNTG